MITTDYVLDEVFTLLRLRHGVDVALKFLEKMRKSRSIEVVWVDEVVFRQALGVLQAGWGAAVELH